MEKRVFSPEDSFLGDVLDFTESTLFAAGCPMKAILPLQIAVEEVFVNICHYGYPDGKASGRVEMSIDAGNGGITIVFKDNGAFFDPTAKADPDITLSAEDRPIGGLGIYMVKKSTDAMEYRREGDFNVLTLKKAYTPVERN